jgi:predicted aspartyl protease
MQVTFLIDTGASMSMVDESCMRSLQLEPTGATQFHSSSTNGVAQHAAVYDVQLTLGGVATASTLRVDPLPMMATALINQPFEGILGRDVLARLQLAWNGPGQEVRLSYR